MLKGAFIGFGKIAEQGHWPSYAHSKEVEIVAVMDAAPARQAAAKALRPDLRTYSSTADLFQSETLDFVDICTPPSSHAAFTLEAISHSCHVLCEKPLTLKKSEYLEISQAMTRSGKTVFTVHNWKFAPIFQKAFAFLREGRIGAVEHVEMITLRDNACKGTDTGVQKEDWRKNAALAGGGILVDHGWHTFYLLLNLVGGQPQSILAKMLKSSGQPDSLEEAVQALVQFPTAEGHIQLTWLADTRRNSVIIQGKRGTLLLDDDRLLFSTQEGAREELRFDSPLSSGSHHADWFQSLLPAFLEEIKNPAVRGANFKEAGWCQALLEGAYESHRRGAAVIPVSFPSLQQMS